ncbi:MAG: response regulator [Desulfobacterales bacterium]|nr:response regulator [Desulfobacterales bacterium]
MNNAFKIYVLDDDIAIVNLLLKILENNGYSALGSTNCDNYMDVLSEFHPDLFILDVMLGDKNGLDICFEIKSIPEFSDMYILLLSGIKTELSDRTKGFTIGADAYIAKPFSYKEILIKIKHFADLKHKTSALIESEERFNKDFDTERKHFEQQLQSRLSFIDSLINTMPNPVFYKDISGKYLGCNHAFEVFIGRSKEDIIGKTVFEISPKEVAQTYWEKDNELFNNPGIQQYEYKVIQKTGETRNVRSNF